ncbi:DUF932 domain-containing protein [Thalassobaculum litoreum]|uniref:DUF945 domain-containing protein n=1 Tax=Thalassobaculum litoreum DSM 18839 TaxID=1123362 RepID=A0A8G2BI51_9PROT|nr:DUF932 domain-containing protein [Thalassobaculum litoreum]SDF83134.1 protein of unknown function [Thalassobaculum litoreum DSM 18839]
MNRYMRGMSNGGMIAARGAEPLTLEAIASRVPSIFAAEAHESRSDRYAYIPTAEVLSGLMREGFQPFFAQQSRTRVEGKENFTKHMVRLRHQSRTNEHDEAHEIILINAHDGTSSYQMINGVFRFVCANGLFTGDTFGETKVNHTGDAVSKVIEGAFTVLEDADRVMHDVHEMKALPLSDGEQAAFAKAVHSLRYEEEEKAPVAADRLLTSRRSADAGADLWSTFNRLQENVIRGGQRGWVRNAEGQVRRSSVREVKGIDQNRNLNRAMWTLAEEMARLKGAPLAVAA